MTILTPDQFRRAELVAGNLGAARDLLLQRIKALAPAVRGLPSNEDDSRRLQFADDFLRDSWEIRALGFVEEGRTPDECDELLLTLEAALGNIEQLVQAWLQRRAARR
ncbi:hypothetical protein IVB18_21260 [Bradyrhizobium sp. 186]|uniref:hypothetical protein n=1 Tax=Bradyrhizobium sp. 186 TaxID=2782654 RepID=UPI002001A1F4|nr:hypothetical protein [Bradyrhizobium sp. 186]UPK39524.1 hypothetical protein IVB18_21260 [Bradyrhizobium sp. 186]